MSQNGYSLRACTAHAVIAPTKGNLLDESTINNWNWRIYWQGELLYSGSQAASALKLNGNASYTVVAWANTSIPAASTGSLEALLNHTCEFTDVQTDWDSGGNIPMSFYAKDISGEELDMLDGNEDGVIVLPMERIMAKVNLNIEYDSLTDTMFNTGLYAGDGISVNSIGLGGMHQSVGLFRSEVNSRHAADGDVVIDQSDDGNPVYSFYIPESLGGNLLAGNTDPMQKSGTTLASMGLEPSSYPYIEADLSLYAVHVAHNVHKTYRLYLGEDSFSNFDIKRNHIYNITLLITYNGLDCTGEWKIEGSDLEDRRAMRISALDHKVAPGESVVIDSYYQYNYINDVADRYYLRSNGFAIGLADDADAYLSDGIAPAGFRKLSSDFYMFICNECGHCYTDYPKTTDRTQWRLEKLTTSGMNVYCRWCGQYLFQITGADEEWYNFRSSTTTWSTSVCEVTLQDGSMSEYTLPSSASPGDEITFYAWTRDGRRMDTDIISVSTGTAPSLTSSAGRTNWIAQQNVISVSEWAQGTYGDNPVFTFQISCENSAHVSDASVASLSPYTGNDYPAGRSVVVNCLKSGSYTVSIKYDGTPVDDAYYYAEICSPIIGYPDSSPTDYSTTGVSVNNGGGLSHFSKPVYLRCNALGKWIQYDDYSPDLFASCLGPISGSLLDNNGWVSFTDGSPASVHLAHAYKNGLVSDSNLLPFRNPSQRLDLLRFYSPVSGSVSPCNVPVYFSGKYRNLGLVRIIPQYLHFFADEDKVQSQPDTRFDISSWYSDALDPSEFFGEKNGIQCGWNEIISPLGGGSYSFNTEGTGYRRVYWLLKGSGSDSFKQDICRITLKDKYIGTIYTSNEKPFDNKLYFVGGGNPSPGFEAWESENSVRYKGFVSNGFTNEGYNFTVGCRNIVDELFCIEHRAFLPTEDAYDPVPEVSLFSYLYENWCHNPGNRNAVYYAKAKHIYNDTDMTYIPVMARYAGYYENILFISGYMRSFETKGYNMKRYKSFNPPLFKPRSSPVTVNGTVWNKTSDNGTIAVWTSADGYRICEFKYGEWDN